VKPAVYVALLKLKRKDTSALPCAHDGSKLFQRMTIWPLQFLVTLHHSTVSS